MFKKSSRAKNIRRKIETADEELNEQVHVHKTVTSTEKKKKQSKKSNPLSFNETEEGEQETFQIKKSKALHVPAPSQQDDMDVDRESYSQDILEKLKAATPNLPKSVRSSMQDESDALLHEKFPSIKTPLSNQSIPDASAILAAKKKREQMRKGLSIVDSDDGFIPLDESAEEKETGSRLVREEDDMMDDGEAEFEKYVGDKLLLGKNTARAQEKERREGVREMIEEAEEDDEQLEEMARWENDMIRFGGVKPKQDAFDPYRTPTHYRPAQVPEAAALPTLTEMMRILDTSTAQVNESIDQYQSNLAESLKMVESSSQAEIDLMNQIEKGSQRYDYFQELAQYVNDLGEFLDAKFPELEKLELEVHDIMATKTEVVSSRRWQFQLDDLCQFNTIQFDQLKEEEEEELDEFGRVRELRHSESARQRRWDERQQRIQKRADLAELVEEEAIREQGLWTDDDMTDEYEDKRERQLQAAQTEGIQAMMADVGSAFSQLRAVKDRFEGWKVDFTEDYAKAYGSLSLPGAFEFYVRAELVAWNPFSDPIDFDSMHWHSVLSEYGVSREQADPDVEMLNKVVEKAIIKKVKSLLDTLDAASSRQMRCAAQTIEQITYYVDSEEKAYQELAMEIIGVLEKQLSHFVDTIATAIPKSDLTPAAIEAKHRFFWSQCKYLKTLMVWRRLLPKAHLDRLGSIVMDRIITPILKPESDAADLHLQNEALLLLSHLQK
ncbi:nineteen complex-related protein 2-domain-containing protein [Choanephora cucurbitarum]|nr:nineteen complex-related protein 2-domain-containing protein [Choanephora cucurbitarum]